MELGGGGAAHLVSNSSAPPARRLKVLRFLVVVAAVAAAVSSQLLPPSVVIVPSSWPFTSAPDFKKQQPLAPPECVVFNFGDSNSDTGGRVAAGFESILPPYGSTFFGGPAGRFCDGRLILDFLSTLASRSLSIPSS